MRSGSVEGVAGRLLALLACTDFGTTYRFAVSTVRYPRKLFAAKLSGDVNFCKEGVKSIVSGTFQKLQMTWGY